MSVSMAVLTFLNVWWIMLFFVLAFGVQKETAGRAGGYVAAPRARAWKRTFLINTGLSIIVTAVIAVVIKSGIVPLHDMLNIEG